MAPLHMLQHPTVCTALVHGPLGNGPLVSGGADGVIRCWNTQEGEQSGSITACTTPIRDLEVHEQEELIWATAEDKLFGFDVTAV